MEDGEALDDGGSALARRTAPPETSSRQGVFPFVALVSVDGAVVGLVDGPFGLGAAEAGGDDAAGFVVGLGGVAELVGGGFELSGRAAPLAEAEPLGAGEVLGAFEPGVVGVHATIAATRTEAAAAR
jgi:hypothetical protein